MQEHTPNQKRKQLAFRYFTYGVMSLAVVVISAVTLLLALGYGFDFKQNTVVQRALVQFRSFPDGARIILDNKELSARTPNKANVDVGQRSFTMKLEGYYDWTKNVTLDAGELRWLNYTRFVPLAIKTTQVREFPLLSGGIPAPDRKWMALWGDPSRPELTIADLRDERAVKFETFMLPPDSYTVVPGQPGTFELVEWDFGARFILVRHTVAGKTEFIRIDRTQQAGAVNITTKLNIPINEIQFSGTSGNVFYARDTTDLRKLDIAAGTISGPVASNASSFVLYRTDTLSYVSDRDAKRMVGVKINDQERVAVRNYDTTQPVLTSVSSYFSDVYLAVARGTSVEIIKNPMDVTESKKSYATITLPVRPAWLQFGSSGRFVVAGTGTQFVTYDLETKETFSVNLPGTSSETRPLQWLDDYILVSTADQKLRLSEFDGANQHDIVSVDPRFYVTLSENGKRLFSVTKTTSGYSLQSSLMTNP